jgi:diguanylate cyclase (GGDEF)-like protein
MIPSEAGCLMASDRDVSSVLSEFARTLVTDFPIQAILDHLVRRIVEIMPITGAGVTLIEEGKAPRYIASSNAAALSFEKLQTALDEGPCLAAFRSGEAIAVPDMRLEHRFPAFAAQAERMGLRAVFTFPLRQGEERLGALDLYNDQPGVLDESTMVVAQTLADVASAYVVNAQARADMRDSADKFRESSLHDALTGLPNRILLGQRLDHAVMRALRSGKKLAVLFVDMDRFKEVNDTLGHKIGDLLLMAIADRLTLILRPGDTLARMAGDEFVILCEDLDDAAVAEDLAARVGSCLEEVFILEDQQLTMSASVGIAYSGEGVDVPERILQDADTAMYQAKASGGAHHQIIDLREQDLAQAEASLLHDLRGALSRGELQTVYQPIVRTTDGAVTGVEALLRWADPVRGLIMPKVIVPVAEESGLMVEIGRWVLEQACRVRTVLVGSGHEPLMMSVNVSPHQLMSPNFTADVAAVLARTGTDPGAVMLEVTEGVFLQDDGRAFAVLKALKELGVSIALDDFGTGYSSLSYLRRFPADVVKLDNAFVGDLGDPITSAITSAVVDLAHVLGMSVVAEGVETAEQHAQVTALGCDACQGFLFAEAMTLDTLGGLMIRGNGDHALLLPVIATA